MESVVETLADDIYNAFIVTSADAASVAQPMLVAIAGAPGSGKTTLAKRVAALLNENGHNLSASQQHSKVVSGQPKYEEPELEDFAPAGGVTATASICLREAFVMGMDGYHLYRRELDAMPNAEEAYRRRGVEWTFNPRKLRDDLQQLKTTGKLLAPSFDHALKDPTPDAIRIDARTMTTADVSEPGAGAVVERSIVIVEGLYLAMRDPPDWAAVNDLFDLVVFLNCPSEVATERLIKRHMAAWGITREEAAVRAAGSDRDNGEIVATTAINAHVEIHSCEDEGFAAST